MRFKEVEKMLEDYQPEHSLFQIENFIIGTGGHPWERYKQCLRELSSRHESLKNSVEGMEKIKSVKKKPNFFQRLFGRRLDIDDKKISEMSKSIESKKREYNIFYHIAADLKKSIGEVTEGRRNQLEAEAWLHKARFVAAVDLLSLGGLQRSTVDFIASFPIKMRHQLFKDIKVENRQRLLEIIDNEK